MTRTVADDHTVQMQPFVLAAAIECIGRFFQHQGLSRLASACEAEASDKHSETADSESESARQGDRLNHAETHMDLAGLAHALLQLEEHRSHLTSRVDVGLCRAGSSTDDTDGETAEAIVKREVPLTISHEALSFMWQLLPPFIEKPATIAAMASLAKLSCQSLCDDSDFYIRRLCVGHALLHPNSLGPTAAASESEAGLLGNGILQRISFNALVSTQFHVPRLSEAFRLLEILADSPCYSLCKIVDRQSRWRPRDQRFDSLDAAGLARAAALVSALGGLPKLRHLEGPIFSIILRAYGQQAKKRQEGKESENVGTRQALPHSWLEEIPDGAPSPSAEKVRDDGLGNKLEVIHLMDAAKEDLLGLWEPLYMKLNKLVLLNLPAVSPGLTARAVVAFLPKVPNLVELQLDFAFFDPPAWEAESTALESLVKRVQMEPSKISRFVLEWCRLGDAGVRRICDTFCQHPEGSVTELSLAHCEMRDVTSVCEMLETPGLSLTRLDLSSNSLDDCQAARLAKVLPLSQVKELRLRDSQVSVPLPVKTEWFWGC